MQAEELVSKLPVISSVPVGIIEEEAAADSYLINPDLENPQKYPGTLLIGLILIGIILIPATSVLTNEFSAWYMGRHHKDARPPLMRLAILLFFLILGFGLIYFLYTYTVLFTIPIERQSTTKTKSVSSNPQGNQKPNVFTKPLPHPIHI